MSAAWILMCPSTGIAWIFIRGPSASLADLARDVRLVVPPPVGLDSREPGESQSNETGGPGSGVVVGGGCLLSWLFCRTVGVCQGFVSWSGKGPPCTTVSDYTGEHCS